MKKLSTVLLIFLLIICMTACGKSADAAKSIASVSNIEFEYVTPDELKGDTDISSQGNETEQNTSEETNNGNSESSQDPPPAPPDGNGGPGGDGQSEPPAPPDGNGVPSVDNAGGPGGMPGGSGGPNTTTFDFAGTYNGALTADGQTVESSDETITATESDQNAVLAQNGGTVSVNGGTIRKSGSDQNGDNCNFYGMNSSVLSVGEDSKVYLSNTEIQSDSEGSNGIFATDSGTVYANNVTVTTTEGNSSRGLDATYGGVIYGNEIKVSTEGDHCAALATDRGGGYISVTNSSLNTSGSGSPLIYSTGDIEVDNVSGTASGSQIAGMEGVNRIVIYNSELTSTNDDRSGSDPIKNGVILYQSTSGDADTSTGNIADFEAISSKLSTSISDGAMFYVTNTTAKVVLMDTELVYGDGVDLINAVGNSNNWGKTGSNGGNVIFTAYGENLKGTIKADTISSADVYLMNGTTWTGNTVIEDTGETTSDAPVTINVSADSSWIVTENCTVSALNVEAGGTVVDENGKTVTIVNGTETIQEGDSDITVTVSGAYSDTVTTDSNNDVNVKVLDRSDLDSYFGIETAYGKN